MVEGFNDMEIIECHRGQGMSMLLAHRLLREIQKHPSRKVYVNFELPKVAKETIEKYASIEQIELQDAKHKVD